MITKREVIFLLIIFIAAFMIRVWPIETVHWWDETVYLQHSEIIFSGRTNYDEFNLRPPLMPLIIAGSYWIWHDPFMANIMVAILCATGAIFIYLLAKQLYNPVAGVMASLLFALSSFVIANSGRIMTDAPAVSLLILTMYFLFSNLKYKYIYTSIFAALAILTRFTSMVFLTAIAVYFLINRIRFKQWLTFIFSFILVMSPYLIWAQIRFGAFFYPFVGAVAAVSDHTAGLTFYLFNLQNIVSISGLIGLLLWLFFIIRMKTITKKEMALLIGFLILFIYHSITAHKEIRYILPIVIPLILFSAKGYAELINFFKNNRRIRICLYFIFITIIFISGMPVLKVFSLPLINSDKSEEVIISKYIESNFPNELLYSNINYPVYAYYTTNPTVVIWPQDASFYETFPKNMVCSGLFIKYKSIKEPNEEWLDHNPNFKQIKEFDNVILYKYNENNTSTICYDRKLIQQEINQLAYLQWSKERALRLSIGEVPFK